MTKKKETGLEQWKMSEVNKAFGYSKQYIRANTKGSDLHEAIKNRLREYWLKIKKEFKI